MSGNIRYRLTVVDPLGTAFVPGQTADPDDHFFVTSRRRVSHPWIKDPPEGEGQKLDLITGKTEDGAYVVRVIDVPAGCNWTTTVPATDWVAPDPFWGVLGGRWQDDPRWSFHSVYGDSSHFQDTGYPAIAYFVMSRFGATFTPGDQYIQRTFTGFAPFARVRLNGSLKWEYYSSAIADPNVRMTLYINGDEFTAIPSGFPPTDPSILPFTFEGFADASGNVVVQYGLFGDSGGGSISLSAVWYATSLETCEYGAVSGGDYYVTQWLADTEARQRLLGRQAYLEQTFDDGATWQMLQAGYVTGIQMQNSLVYEFSIGDTRRVERNRGAWRNLTPTTDPNFTQVTAFIGGPVYGGFEPYSPSFAMPIFQVIAAQFASGSIGPDDQSDGWALLQYVSGPMPPGFRNASNHGLKLGVAGLLNDRAQAFYDDAGPQYAGQSGGSFPGLRATIFDASQAILEDDMTPMAVLGNVTFPQITWRRTFTNPSLQVLLQWRRRSPAASLVGDFVSLLITPRAISDKFPLYWRGHPVDLEYALLTRAGVPVNVASVSTAKDALGIDLTTVQRFTDPNQTVQAVCDALHAFYGYFTRINDAGEREFVAFRPFVDSTPSLSVDTDALRAEGGPTYRLEERSRKNRLVVKQQYFLPIDLNDSSKTAEFPDAIEAKDSTITEDYSTDGGATLDADTVGAQEVSFELNGHVALTPSTGVLSDGQPVAQKQWVRGVARKLFNDTGRGVQEAMIIARRSTDADSAYIGDPVLLDAAHVPNAQIAQSPTSQRGGERWWRVAQRVEASEGAELLLVDAGTGVPYAHSTALNVFPDAYEPGSYVTCAILSSTQFYADAAWCEIEVAMGTPPSGHGTRYTILDGLAMTDASGSPANPYEVRLGPFPYNEIVWVRARGFLKGGTPGAWSAWTAASGPVQTPGSGLSNLVFYNVSNVGLTVAWQNADVTNQVRVQYRLNDTGAYTTDATLSIGSVTHNLAPLTAGARYGIRVVLWNGVAEVGTALHGIVVLTGGAIASLVVGTPGPNSVGLTWSNSHPTFGVKVQYRVTGTTTYTTIAVLPAGSIQFTLSGLTPSTGYDVRVVLVTPSGTEYGGALTDSFTTASASVTALATPTSISPFAGYDPLTGTVIPGHYGVRLVAAPANPPSHLIVVSEAVETSVGSNTPGAYSEVASLPAVAGGYTYYANNAPNDGLKRYLKAVSRLSGYADSAATSVVSVDPWGTTVVPPGGGGVVIGVLDDLGDVDTTTYPPAADDVLLYDGSIWRPAEIVTDGSDVVVDHVTGNIIYT